MSSTIREEQSVSSNSKLFRRLLGALSVLSAWGVILAAIFLWLNFYYYTSWGWSIDDKSHRFYFAFLKSFVVLLVSLNILWLALKNLPERYVKYLSSVIVIGVLLPRAGVEVILLHLERSLIQNADFPTPEWFRLSLVCFLFSPWIFLYAAIAYLKFGRIKTVV